MEQSTESAQDLILDSVFPKCRESLLSESHLLVLDNSALRIYSTEALFLWNKNRAGSNPESNGITHCFVIKIVMHLNFPYHCCTVSPAVEDKSQNSLFAWWTILACTLSAIYSLQNAMIICRADYSLCVLEAKHSK